MSFPKQEIRTFEKNGSGSEYSENLKKVRDTSVTSGGPKKGLAWYENRNELNIERVISLYPDISKPFDIAIHRSSLDEFDPL